MTDSQANVLMISALSHILSGFSIFPCPYTHCRLKFKYHKSHAIFSFYCIHQRSTHAGDHRILSADVCLLCLPWEIWSLSKQLLLMVQGSPIPWKGRGHETRLPNNVKNLCTFYIRTLNHGSKGQWSPSCHPSGLDMCSDIRLLPFTERERGFPFI